MAALMRASDDRPAPVDLDCNADGYGGECTMCNGEICALCGAGAWRNPADDGIKCDHDVSDRHTTAIGWNRPGRDPSRPWVGLGWLTLAAALSWVARVSLEWCGRAERRSAAARARAGLPGYNLPKRAERPTRG